MKRLFLLISIIITLAATHVLAGSLCSEKRLTPSNYPAQFKKIRNELNVNDIDFKSKILMEIGGNKSETCLWNAFLFVDFALYFDRLDDLNINIEKELHSILKFRDTLYSSWISANKIAPKMYAEHINKNVTGMKYEEFIELKSDYFSYAETPLKLLNRRPRHNSEKQFVYDLLSVKTPFNVIFPFHVKKMVEREDVRTKLSCISKTISDLSASPSTHLYTSLLKCTIDELELVEILGVLSSQRMYVLRDLTHWFKSNLDEKGFDRFYQIASLSSEIYFKLETFGRIHGAHHLYPVRLERVMHSSKPYHFYSVAFITQEMTRQGYDTDSIRKYSSFYARKYKKNIRLVGLVHNTFSGIALKAGSVGDTKQVLSEQKTATEYVIENDNILTTSSPSTDDLNGVLKSTLKYLQREQVKTDNYPLKLKGEWPSFMMVENSTTLLGTKGKQAWDSNCFTTASIYNSLSTVIENTPQHAKDIIPMLNPAIDNIHRFENNGMFGFWLKLPRNENLHPTDERAHLPEVRRPNNFYLDNAFANNASNIPEDADDTAIGYLALSKHNALALKYPELTATKIPNTDIKSVFEKYRDRKRKTIHYYNLFHGHTLFTGAYTTWLQKEKIFTPWSWLPIGHKKPYIPYGANEVDCVVNANVLNMLSALKQTDAKGFEASCSFINKAIQEERFAYCGLYYPNHYELHYTTAKALNSGASCLEGSRSKLVSHILRTQNDDGSFSSHYERDFRKKSIEMINKGNALEKLNDRFFRKKYNPKDETVYDDTWVSELDPDDKIQSTAYAIAALIKIGNSNDTTIRKSIDNGLNYILRNTKKNNSGETYLPGGVFFAGGTLVRDDIRWRSDSYTSALMAELISDYLTRYYSYR